MGYVLIRAAREVGFPEKNKYFRMLILREAGSFLCVIPERSLYVQHGPRAHCKQNLHIFPPSLHNTHSPQCTPPRTPHPVSRTLSTVSAPLRPAALQETVYINAGKWQGSPGPRLGRAENMGGRDVCRRQGSRGGRCESSQCTRIVLRQMARLEKGGYTGPRGVAS